MSADRNDAVEPLSFPYGALIATTAMQTLATMAAYAVPALAPVVAKDLGVDGALTGYFISVVYGVGIISSLLAADFIHRYGAVRAGQLVLVCSLAMLIISTWGGVGALAAGAIVLGLGYGATAPSSTHLLVPRTPPRILNFVMSLRQIGVPLGGVLAGLLLPPVALFVGWQKAMLLLAAPILLLLVALEWPRRDWDRQRTPQSQSIPDGLRRLLALLRENPEIRALTMASFIYSGVQLCFVAFMAVHLTARAGFGIVAAGQTLALYQVCGVVSRPIWGWIADRAVPARWLLVAQGCVMAFAAIVAGQFAADWPGWLILATCAIAGASASGYTGIAYAEFARLGGARRTEATGLGSAAMFAGVLIIPSLATVLIIATGSYALAYGAVGIGAASGAVLLASRRAAGSGS
ncbi:MAG: MFS transporter [Burkholderiales bacterium]